LSELPTFFEVVVAAALADDEGLLGVVVAGIDVADIDPPVAVGVGPEELVLAGAVVKPLAVDEPPAVGEPPAVEEPPAVGEPPAVEEPPAWARTQIWLATLRVATLQLAVFLSLGLERLEIGAWKSPQDDMNGEMAYY
jgi:hypothetical protein